MAQLRASVPGLLRSKSGAWTSACVGPWTLPRIPLGSSPAPKLHGLRQSLERSRAAGSRRWHGSLREREGLTLPRLECGSARREPKRSAGASSLACWAMRRSCAASRKRASRVPSCSRTIACPCPCVSLGKGAHPWSGIAELLTGRRRQQIRVNGPRSRRDTRPARLGSRSTRQAHGGSFSSGVAWVGRRRGPMARLLFGRMSQDMAAICS
mmetsp:Transcript_92088/g.205844  ORF Transcript_92088/g.205844 Transcript_92088/m.205844 type:complete len:211 (+) Transcript_92088:244-876(+)